MGDHLNYKEIARQIARQARIKIIEMIYRAQTSHVGSNLSCVDIMTVLFEKMDLDKDRFVLSAGWKAASLYYFLWKKGRITEEELNSYCQKGSKWIGLSEPIHKDISIAGGSMGLGLPGAIGLALAKKLKGEDGKVYVLMSDGELQCGTTWESALIAAHHKLDNLIVIVDCNEFQAMGKIEGILNSTKGRKFDEFGWEEYMINGHDYESLKRLLFLVGKKDKPSYVHVFTIKGKGVSFMENNNLYHYKQLSEEEYNKALEELNG